MTQIVSTIGDVIVAVLFVGGACLGLISSFGLVRLPDFYTRIHAVAKMTTFGALFVLFGSFLYFLFEMNRLEGKLLLAIIFVFITSPISSHLIGRAAYRSGVKLWEGSKHDVLYPLIHGSKTEDHVAAASDERQKSKGDQNS